MHARLPIALVLLTALPGCPLLLSDWRIGGGSAGDASTGTPNFDAASGEDGSGSASDANSESALVASAPSDAYEAEAGAPGIADAGDAPSITGASDAADSGVVVDSGPCVDDLSNLHSGDFRIDFDVLVTGGGGGPLVEQRATCGQYDPHWLIAETQSGNIFTQFYDGSGGPQLQSIAAVNDGVWHHVVVARVALAFSIAIDEQLDNSVSNAVWAPSTLALLQIGRSACASPFAGQIKDVCVMRSAESSAGSGTLDASTFGSDATVDAPPEAGCALVTHNNGVGNTWQDCNPLGTYSAAEQKAACESDYGSGACTLTDPQGGVCGGAGSVACTCWDSDGHVRGGSFPNGSCNATGIDGMWQ